MEYATQRITVKPIETVIKELMTNPVGKHMLFGEINIHLDTVGMVMWQPHTYSTFIGVRISRDGCERMRQK